MDKYLHIVDNVILRAYKEGFTIIEEDIWDRYAVRSRLLLYGYIEDGRFHLNELGVKYVMEGCSEGIRIRNERIKKMEELDIQIKKYKVCTMSKTFWISIIATIASFLSILLQLI